MIDSVTYGSTVICSSRTKLLASGPSGATASPRKSPTRMPSASPASTWCENRMRVGLKCTARPTPPFRAWGWP